VKGDNALNIRQALARYRSKTGFIAFALLTTLLTVSVLVGVSLYSQKPPTNNLANPVSFTCYPSSSNQTFTIEIEANLTDGMDQDEALRVATRVFERNIHSHQRSPTSCSSTAFVRTDGIWIVEFDTVYTSTSYCTSYRDAYYCACRHLGTRFIHEYFEVIINPFVQTVVY